MDLLSQRIDLICGLIEAVLYLTGVCWRSSSAVPYITPCLRAGLPIARYEFVTPIHGGSIDTESGFPTCALAID